MCGIAGIIKLKKNLFCDKNKIFNLMNNRGPDGKGPLDSQVTFRT